VLFPYDLLYSQGKEKGVLYLGRIPHGFYEEEMKAYFSQFGDISRLRLARNKKVRRRCIPNHSLS
jgi:RNA recognition motif-containing protein